MKKELLSSRIFDSRVPEERITGKEKVLGFFMGPIAVMVMNSILSNYLNVYYTDVLKISAIWGGAFISLFPIVAKVLDVLTFIYMGLVVDRTRSRQGKARPWILFAAPLMFACMILLFVVPRGNDDVTAVWIFLSYTIFYAVAYTMYSTAHTLMVPLATRNDAERRSLSTIANTPGMAVATLGAALCLVHPKNLALVLAGQVVRTVGLIPSTYMVSGLLGDALDDVERVSGERCDGFSSSVFNCIITISGGIALAAFNFGISHLGYQAPTPERIPVQNDAIQGFLIFCVIGVQLIAYPLIGVLTRFFPRER